MKPLALALMLAGGLSAAPITEISPPPPGEGDTIAIIASLFPDFVRIADDLDIDFSAATGEFVFAFEDWQGSHSDRDFNDLIVWTEFDAGSLVDWFQVASYAAASQAFGYDGSYVFDASSIGTAWSAPWLNSDSLDHVATWGRSQDLPPSEVPGPSTWLMLVGGLFLGRGLRGFRRRRGASVRAGGLSD